MTLEVYHAASQRRLSAMVERVERDHVILAPAHERIGRRVLFVNCYGGRADWEKIKAGLIPAHHLWGCLELVKMGYEVAIVEPLSDFYLYRNPFPHDLRLFSLARSWLRPNDIIYCGHNNLFWIPLLKRLGIIRCHVVSLLYGREPLDFSRAHRGIIAINGAAADHARKIAPQARVAQLGWGVDLDFFPHLPFRPHSHLACGITQRDHRTLADAAAKSGVPVRVICPGLPKDISWPSNVDVTDGGPGFNTQQKKVSYEQLLHDYYAKCSASLVILKEDPREYTGCGFTNVIEALAMARPVIVTKTGALPTELDVEKSGCGVFVPPGDSDALADAMATLTNNPTLAQKLGEKGRQLAEERYNIERYSRDLHLFFESL